MSSVVHRHVNSRSYGYCWQHNSLIIKIQIFLQITAHIVSLDWTDLGSKQRSLLESRRFCECYSALRNENFLVRTKTEIICEKLLLLFLLWSKRYKQAAPKTLKLIIERIGLLRVKNVMPFTFKLYDITFISSSSLHKTNSCHHWYSS